MLDLRDVLPYPAGDNSSDTIISGVHFNTTALNYWNYTYYSNGTFSNGSNCFLTFKPYTPKLLSNGTFLNTTSCYSPINPLGPRSELGVAMGIIFGISIIITLMNLRRHGRLFLPGTKRFHPIGRRWQWYWMLVVAGCAMISGFTGVDVDRYYLPELPIVLENFFWLCMLPATLAAIWESVRHWGSWQERQLIDPNPFMLKQDDMRGRKEFYMPLIFYFFDFMNFFMVIPRPWGKIEMQRSVEQTNAVAEPMATDGRFKASAFFLFFAWVTIVYCQLHNLHYYKPRNRGLFGSILGFVKYTPVKFLLAIPLALIMVGYAAASFFDFTISSLSLGADPAYIYGFGWGPILLIFLVYEVYGYIDPNEDKELIRQRSIRGAEIDQELGITKKPHWWGNLHGKHGMNVHEQIAQNVREVGGGAAAASSIESSIEMGNMAVSKKQERTVTEIDARRMAADLLFPAPSGTRERSDPFADTPIRGASSLRSEFSDKGGKPLGSEARNSVRPQTAERSNSTVTQSSGGTLNAKPQKIISMLDV